MPDPQTSREASLLPCPFNCEREVVLSSQLLGTARELLTAVDQYSYQVRCLCGACGPESYTAEIAIAAWNTRALPSNGGREDELAGRLRLAACGARLTNVERDDIRAAADALTPDLNKLSSELYALGWNEAIREAARVAEERAERRKKTLRSDTFDPDHDWDEQIYASEQIAAAIRNLREKTDG